MLVRWTSTVLWVTKSACAISRFVGPSAAISATRRSLGVSDSTPLKAIRRGRAPVARSSLMGARFPYYLLADSADGRKKEEQLTGQRRINSRRLLCK
jgi:hypothetical protein